MLSLKKIILAVLDVISESRVKLVMPLDKYVAQQSPKSIADVENSIQRFFGGHREA